MFPSSVKTCAVIPFYNEKGTIKKVVEQSLSFVDFVIAVNDGSTDGSEKEIYGYDNVYLINFEINTGKGAALKTGFLKSIELVTNLTITLDADLQHPPELIPEFFKKLEDNDILIGNRLKNKGKMPIQRILSNTLTSMIMTLKTGQKILDSQNGFRLYKTSILNDILTSNNGYEAESEIIIKASKKNYKIGFIDIPAIYNNEKSKMNPFKAILGFLKVILS